MKTIQLNQLEAEILQDAIKLYDNSQYKSALERIQPLHLKTFQKITDIDKTKISHLYYVTGKRKQSLTKLGEAHKYFEKAKDIYPNLSLIDLRQESLKEFIRYWSNETLKQHIFYDMVKHMGEYRYTEIDKANNSLLKYIFKISVITPHSFTPYRHPKLVIALGDYHPYKPDHKWTWVIREMKGPHYFGHSRDPDEEMATGIALIMSQYLRQTFIKILADIDVIVPVPCNPQNLPDRNYKEPTIHLANALSQFTGIPYERCLIRKYSFMLNPDVGNVLDKKHVLLLDDVYTNGGTMSQCTQIILDAGAATVVGIVAGRTGGMGEWKYKGSKFYE